MRVLLRLTLVVLAVCSFQLARCDDGEPSGETVEEPRVSEELVDKKDGIRSGTRRTTTQPSVNVTRDSQLLSVLAARRRQLLNGRLATHINTLAALAHKNKGNTTFAQLEVRDSNRSIVKRITFDNGSNEAAPSLKIVTTDGTREIKQDVKPHEIRHLFIPKVYQETRSRGGFLNNRRKELNITKVSNASQEVVTEHVAVYIPPEKLEGLDKEIELDPEEEFQVDESNHGLYLLNYSDTDNVTLSSELNKTLNANETKENSVAKPDGSTIKNHALNETKMPERKEKATESNNNTINSTEESNKLIKVESEKDKDNNTLFMSDEIYNHFRPLESELPVEDMAPFLYFGQKLAGQIISDNLTNSPTLSASTKSVNFIIAPHERRKFNSRYSVTEKYKNSSVDEEEVNEDMDVSVVKNIIEKNKVRNTVKGTAPGRHVGLVNAYRKYTTSSTSKPPTIAQLNVTDPMISVTPSTLDKSKDSNKTNTTVLKESLIKINSTITNNDSIVENSNINKNIQNRTISASPRNHTRTYHNLRRRPARVITSASTDNIPIVTVANATTEKAATLVYTAVVTSVSITSSVKGQNKTDTNATDTVVNNNSDVIGELILSDKENNTIPKAILLEDTETTASAISSTSKPYKHRIRIRTTTTENPSTPLHRSTDAPVASELSAKDIEQRNEATQLRISERLASLYGKPEVDTTPSNTTMKPKNILRRRRPTTTSTTPSSTALPTTFSTERPIPISRRPLTTLSSLPTTITTVSTILPITTEVPETTENTFKPFIVTSRTSSESSSKPFNPQGTNVNRETNTTKFNMTWNNREEGPVDEEVVIEAEKAYTTSYVLAGLGFLPVAAIVAFVLRSVFNKRTKEIDTEYEGYFEDGDTKKESPIIPVARPPIPPPSKPDQKWEFPRNKLRLQTLLGQGNFGQVWKAQADDLTGHDGLTRLVAVKSIKETASQKEKQELLHEIFVMQKIGTHPNVVTLLACCTEQEPYLLIMEYVMCGKLLTYLRERRSRPDRFSGSGALTSRDLTVFAYCVARGMDYIASKGIVHRDLAARNVLVDHNKLCKIADFGMSREVAGGEERAKQRHALPVRWMAPEALLYNAYNHETDVWAYGILLWEIVTLGSTPYAAMTGREVLAAVTEGYRLERPPHCKPQLYRAMHSCWHADPTQRPSFAALKSQLADLLDNEPAEGNYVDLESFYQESSVYSDPSAIIHDEEGLSAEYDRERRVFRELAPGPKKYDNRGFNFRDEDLRNKFSIGTPRMGGFGIRDVPFSGDFTDRQFARDEKTFNERNFGESNFNSNFKEPNFNERKDGKLSTSSFHRDRERENPLVSRNSFSGFPRLSSQNTHFQLMPDGRNKRVSEFECDI